MCEGSRLGDSDGMVVDVGRGGFCGRLTEGGQYLVAVGDGQEVVDEDRQVAAGMVVEEGQDSAGPGLFETGRSMAGEEGEGGERAEAGGLPKDGSEFRMVLYEGGSEIRPFARAAEKLGVEEVSAGCELGSWTAGGSEELRHGEVVLVASVTGTGRARR